MPGGWVGCLWMGSNHLSRSDAVNYLVAVAALGWLWALTGVAVSSKWLLAIGVFAVEGANASLYPRTS